MAKQIDRRDQCCLCGKTKDQVSKLIVGLHGAVCVNCIDLCSDILRDNPYATSQLQTTEGDEGYSLDLPADLAKFFPDRGEILELLRFLMNTVGSRALRHALEARVEPREQ